MEGHGRVDSQQESKALQTKRLTKTLTFVSTLALLSWIPLIILNCLFAATLSINERYYIIGNIQNYSNSFDFRILILEFLSLNKRFFRAVLEGKQH